MGIEINLSGLKVSGEARILNDASIKNSNNVNIKLHDSEVGEEAVILDNLKIDPILEELRRRIPQMDKNVDEYSAVQEILEVKQWSKKDFAKRVTKHLGEFSQGVLASVIANIFTKL